MSENELFDAVRAELSSIPTAIEERVTKPLDAVLKHAAEVHAAALELLQAGKAAGGPEERHALARYRKSVAADVSAYLLESIEEANAGATVGSIFTDRKQRLSEIVADAPEGALPPDGTVPSPSRRRTSVIKRLRKAGSRLFQRPESGQEAALPRQDLSPRQVLQFQLDERIAADLLPIHDRVQQTIAQHYAALESDVSDWAFAVVALGDDFQRDDIGTQQDDGSLPHPKDENPRTANGSHNTAIDRVVASMERLSRYEFEPLPDDLFQQLEQVCARVSADLPAVLLAPSEPLVRSKRRIALRPVGTETPEWKKHRVRWVRWHTQVLNRIRLNHSVLVLHEKFARNAAEILSEVRCDVVEPVKTALEAAELWLDSAGPTIKNAFDMAANEDDRRLIDTLEGVERDATVELQRLFRGAELRNAQATLNDLGVARWENLTKSVAGLPDDLMVHGLWRDPTLPINAGRRPYSIDLREIATSVLVPDWPSLLSDAAEPLKAKIAKALVGAEQLQNVIDYNLGAAIEELQRQSDSNVGPRGKDDDGTPNQTPLEIARELAEDALRRSQEFVDALGGSLDEPSLELARAFDAGVQDDWRDLINQVELDNMAGETWVGLRTRTLRRTKRLKDRAFGFWNAALSKTRQKSSMLRRLVTRLIRRGRTAVGLGEEADEDESTIADALCNAESVRKALPLVYRRLFRIGDIVEPSLMQGRGRDLVTVRRRFEKWRSGGGVGTLILTGRVGGGRTSFLEALRAKVFDECIVRSFNVEDRVSAAQQLVEGLSDELSVPRDARDWDGIEAELRRREMSGTPTVYVIDNLEHLMLQAAGGTELLEEILTVMVRTDHAVFWLATMSAEAWRYFVKVAGMSSAVVGAHSLATIGRTEAEDIILARHHRSGITLRFKHPADPSPILKRRLRRAASPEREQEILQEVYFDAAFKHAGGHTGLTLLYWLRSVEFEDDGDVVAIKPLHPMSFDQLKRLDLPRLFSLKAFILHNTLTADELAMVLRVPVDRAALLLEALLRLAVIERSHADGVELDGLMDCAKERFRLSRLVVHPVTELLRGARILY